MDYFPLFYRATDIKLKADKGSIRLILSSFSKIDTKYSLSLKKEEIPGFYVFKDSLNSPESKEAFAYNMYQFLETVTSYMSLKAYTNGVKKAPGEWDLYRKQQYGLERMRRVINEFYGYIKEK